MPTCAHGPQPMTIKISLGRLALRERIQERVGRAIVDLAVRRRDRADRGEQREEVERLVTREFVEDLHALHFRREDRVRDALLLELDDAVLQHACGVDDAVELPKFFLRLRQRGPQRVTVGDVARHHQHVRAKLAPFGQLPFLRRVGLAVAG